MKKIFLCLLVVLITVGLAGCWSSEEPKNLGISNSIIYDLDENNNYTATMQIFNTSAIGSAESSTIGGKNTGLVIEGKGTSFPEAIYDMTSRVGKSIFGAHNKVRFITERLASKDYAVKKLLDYILRDTLVDETSIIIVIKDEDKEKVYNSSIGLATLVGNYLDKMHTKKQEQTSNAVFMRSFEFIRDCFLEGKEPVLGRISFDESILTPSLNPGEVAKDAEYTMKCEGLAIFKDYAFIDYLDGEDTNIYNIVVNNSRVLNYDVLYEEDTVTVSISKPKTDIKVTKIGQTINVDLKIKGDMALSTFFIKGANNENYKDLIKRIETDVNNSLKEKTLDSIKRGQEIGSDIYGFGQVLHEDHPDVWREISNEWDNYFKNAVINVEYDLKITREGEINRPIIKE